MGQLTASHAVELLSLVVNIKFSMCVPTLQVSDLRDDLLIVALC